MIDKNEVMIVHGFSDDNPSGESMIYEKGMYKIGEDYFKNLKKIYTNVIMIKGKYVKDWSI